MKTVTLATLLATTLGASTPLLADDAGRGIHVYKSPSCGCCTDWVRHLQDHGFKVTVSETGNLNPIKAGAGLTPALASCHTAFIDGYVIEGHVPATDIRRADHRGPQGPRSQRSGMPAGAPGMTMGGRQDPYQVLLFNDAGQTRVFAEYR